MYIGDWKDGKPSGEGELQYVNGSRYKGAWKDGVPHGVGVFSSSNSVKEGSWAYGKLHGYGSEKHSSGWQYSGFWVMGKWEGRGVMHYADGTTYEGSWKEGMRHGAGKLIERQPQQPDKLPQIPDKLPQIPDKLPQLPDKPPLPKLPSQKLTVDPPQGSAAVEGVVLYDGDWVNDKQEGRGTMRYSDGSVYVGQWRDGKRNGIGTYSTKLLNEPDESKYEKYDGEWVADRKQGRGLSITPGGKYEGTFKDDRYNGLGLLTLADGTVLEGRWLMGSLEGRCVITSPKKESSKSNTTTIMLAKEKEGLAVFGDNTQVALPPRLPILD